jgi:CBS domain-containing protein
MSLQRFCKRPAVTIAPEKTIREACQLLEERNVGCLLVEEQDKLCGVLADRDIAVRVGGVCSNGVENRIQASSFLDSFGIPLKKLSPGPRV